MLKITSIPGIGAKRADSFARLGVTTTAELLRHYPRGYQHRGDVRALASGCDGMPHSYLLTVGTVPKNALLKGRMTLTRFSAFDSSGRCTVTYFNQPYRKDQFAVGEEFRFWGVIKQTKYGLELTSPIPERTDGRALREFIPVYRLTDGLSQNMIKEAVASALTLPFPFEETLTEGARERLGLIALRDAVRMIHFPANYEELNSARRRLAFDELYAFAIGMTSARDTRRRAAAPKMEIAWEELAPFFSALPFELTGAQKAAVSDILRDVSGCPRGRMMRMLAGDVGSGKTAVAAAAVYIAARSGYQAAIMAPTEILASQHYSDLAPLLSGLGIKTALLTGSTPTAEKRRIKDALSVGALDLVIGTHALITPDVKFARVGLVVCDEQHRFGVMQRSALTGEGVHMLVMSATPIPRSLALVLCGDLDISHLKEKPPGRQEVDTFLVNEGYRERLNGFIRKLVDEGRQVYIVCPAIEGREDEDGEDYIPASWVPEDEGEPKLKNATETAKKLAEETFPDLSVAFMHGRMRGEEKDSVMRDFAEGRINILVSTTVIEVGVNVPNAALMIIENAERFGLSQLHQLRGRVGRGSHKSYCILVSDTKNPDTKLRLKTLCETTDGYEIAERDLALRGPGDFLPRDSGRIRQHGELRFRLCGIEGDKTLLESAFREAERMQKEDPDCSIPENRAAKRASAVQAEEMGVTFS